MNSHVQTIFISGAGFLLAISLLGLFKHFFPKSKFTPLVTIILLSLPPLLSVLKPGTYESGDLSTHIKFSMAFFKSLTEGNLLPRWAITCGGYGCPHFIFLYILPYYFVSFFHFVGFSFISSVKLVLATSFISSGIAMYFFARELLESDSGVFAALLYLFAPYHLVDLHFRNALGEVVSFVFVPLVFLFSYRIVKKPNVTNIFLNALCLLLLITSHEVTFISTGILLFAFLLFIAFKENKLRNFGSVVISFGVSFLFSAFYWIPILLESKYTKYAGIPSLSFEKLSSFIFSPWRFGLLFQGPTGNLVFPIGYIQLLLIFASVYVLFAKKAKKYSSHLIFFLSAILIYLFMTQKISEPIWKSLPLIKSFQSTYRLMIPISFCASLLSMYILKIFNKRSLTLIICCVAIVSTILNWSPRRNVPEVNDQHLYNELIHGDPSGHDLMDPLWVDTQHAWSLIKPADNLQVLSGEAQVKELKQATNIHQYVVYVRGNALLRENIFYFPRWKVTDNNKETPIIYTDKNFPGIMLFHVTKGLHLISVKFEDPVDQKVANFISIGSFSIALALLFFMKKRPRA